MDKRFEITREEYDKMVADIASLKHSCRKLKKEREENQKTIRELSGKVTGLNVALLMYRGIVENAKERIGLFAKSFDATIVKVRVAKKEGKKPAVVVFWSDGSRDCVRCNPEDEFSVNTGVALCICKHFLDGKLYRKYIVNSDYEVEEAKEKPVKPDSKPASPVAAVSTAETLNTDGAPKVIPTIPAAEVVSGKEEAVKAQETPEKKPEQANGQTAKQVQTQVQTKPVQEKKHKGFLTKYL